jgi:Uma2 family endonuclease
MNSEYHEHLADDVAMATELDGITDYEQERGKPMPSKNHGILQASLIIALHSHLGKKYRAISELSLDLLGDKLTPDICLYPYAPSNWLHDQSPVTEPPLLAIEIVSPSQSTTEMLLKARRYFAGGVQSFWLVEPALQTISVLSPNDTLQTFASGIARDEVVGVELPIAEVFEA